MGFDTELDDGLERVIRALEGNPGLEVLRGSQWVHVRPRGRVVPPHGWKLHVSARHANYRGVLDRVLPRVLEDGCGFKFAGFPFRFGDFELVLGYQDARIRRIHRLDRVYRGWASSAWERRQPVAGGRGRVAGALG